MQGVVNVEHTKGQEMERLEEGYRVHMKRREKVSRSLIKWFSINNKIQKNKIKRQTNIKR